MPYRRVYRDPPAHTAENEALRAHQPDNPHREEVTIEVLLDTGMHGGDAWGQAAEGLTIADDRDDDTDRDHGGHYVRWIRLSGA